MKRAAVLGKPISHSLSPVIHNSGYQESGLEFSYSAIECDSPDLAGFVAGLGPEWVGLSLTMPLKEVALEVADSVSDIARAVGAANTLVRKEDGGWHADNTDVAGMVTALGAVKPKSVAILGAGGTARAALGAAAQLKVKRVVLFARRPSEAAAELEPVAQALRLSLLCHAWSEIARAAQHDVVISTVPKGAPEDLAWRPGAVVFDVVYDPWPTAFAASAEKAGCRIVSGLDLLLAQALGQFKLFTGVEPPVEAMRAALFTKATQR